MIGTSIKLELTSVKLSKGYVTQKSPNAQTLDNQHFLKLKNGSRTIFLFLCSTILGLLSCSTQNPTLLLSSSPEQVQASNLSQMKMQQSSQLFPITQNDKQGYINSTGQIIIKPHFDEVKLFSEGLAAVRIGNKWGYINKTGQVIIAPQFDSTYDFSDGLAAVDISGKMGYVNNTGKIVIQPQFELTYRFREGLAAVRVDINHWGYIDKTGQMVIPTQFPIARDFHEGLAYVEGINGMSSRYGFINRPLAKVVAEVP